MQYKYLSSLIKSWENNPYFDPRENKGCTIEEIDEWKTLIAPYMKRMPKAIEEDLSYFGKYRLNWFGLYLANKKFLLEEEMVDLKDELSTGFWMCYDGYLGVVCDDRQILQYLRQNQVFKIKDYDNPPLCHKDGHIEDDDVEITVTCAKYTDDYSYMLSQLVDEYKAHYAANPKAYNLKQALVELYSEIELIAEQKMENILRKKYEHIAHKIRLNMGSFIGKGEKMEEILYQFHKANRQYNDPETLEELAYYSDKIKPLYNQLIKNWEAVK